MLEWLYSCQPGMRIVTVTYLIEAKGFVPHSRHRGALHQGPQEGGSTSPPGDTAS